MGACTGFGVSVTIVLKVSWAPDTASALQVRARSTRMRWQLCERPYVVCVIEWEGRRFRSMGRLWDVMVLVAFCASRFSPLRSPVHGPLSLYPEVYTVFVWCRWRDCISTLGNKVSGATIVADCVLTGTNARFPACSAVPRCWYGSVWNVLLLLLVISLLRVRGRVAKV